jgi:nitroimidazol reductase NimA-like FMN-containing flavoprotein (pyridoxamine 5'-phosphate oxidase superfamily)
LRRSDKEIIDRGAIGDILKRARICHLSLCDGNKPYVVPLNYGYEGGSLYMHSAREGRKIDIIRRNNLAAFAVYVDERLVTGDASCRFTMKYRSAMGEGKVMLVEGGSEKEKALRIIMRQQAGDGEYHFERASLDKTVILRLDIDQLSGKRSGYLD